MFRKKKLISDEDWETGFYSAMREEGFTRERAEELARDGKGMDEHFKTMDELSHGNPIKGLFRMLTGK